MRNLRQFRNVGPDHKFNIKVLAFHLEARNGKLVQAESKPQGGFCEVEYQRGLTIFKVKAKVEAHSLGGTEVSMLTVPFREATVVREVQEVK